MSANWNERIKAIIDKVKADDDAARAFNYDPPYDEFFPAERIESWQALEQWVTQLDGSWCFRRQRDATWVLSTSLDRAVKIEHQTEHSSGWYHLPRRPIERDYLFRFQQQAQNWDMHLPLN